MMEVAMHGHGRYTGSIDHIASPLPMVAAAPQVDLLPNPDFVFPRLPSLPADQSFGLSVSRRRPISLTPLSQRPQTAEPAHRRGVSALPNFAFNASDASGLSADQPKAELQPDPEPVHATPTKARSGHNRNTSELVGGHASSTVLNASPTRSAAFSIPRRTRRHGHNNSTYSLTSQQWSQVMNGDGQPRLSSSLPNTPLEYPSHVSGSPNPLSDDVFGPASEDSSVRPPSSSRPSVQFSETVEIIPKLNLSGRPLSTISSGTEGSTSTPRGHNVNNSINSIVSLGSTPSPPVYLGRPRTISLETTFEDGSRKAPRSSLEINKRMDKEGHWLKTGVSAESLPRPISEPVVSSPKLTFEDAEPGKKPASSHRKRQSLGNALGFDRRRSEPVIGMRPGEESRVSALSLQESFTGTSPVTEPNRRSSSRKLKDWAISKISRKPRPQSVYLMAPTANVAPDESPISEPAVAETDLDAVFSLDADDTPSGSVGAQPLLEMTSASPSRWSMPAHEAPHGSSTILDLDAALGPFKTPGSAMQSGRRELHSSRGLRDFAGPGGHYLPPSPAHRRTESAPMLSPFYYARTGSPPQAAMDNVFEEDEEEDPSSRPRPDSTQSIPDEEAGVGVQIVDSDMSAPTSTPDQGLEDGLRIRHSEWELERPSTSYANLASRLLTPLLDRRASVIEDTILEESSPVEPTIVQAHEEPRAHSLAKSSDSSETPTLLAAQTGLLAIPDGQHSSVMTPETYQSSAFSSPDFGRRQSSFETSRVGTAASSVTDNRTVSSCTTGEIPPELRVSVDDVPSLTSSRSTMLSTMQANNSRRDVSEMRVPSVASGTLGTAEKRRKRASIQSLSQLMGYSRSNEMDESRPQTAGGPGMQPRKKEHHRLKKLMFWKSKHRQASSSTIL